MQIVAVVLLTILAITLFLSKKSLPNEALERVANVSGVVATITALLVLAFYTASIGSKNQEIHQPIADNSTLDTELNLLAGVWSGEFKTDDAGPWDILLTINGNCRLNEICGTVQYDQTSCNASVKIISVEDNRYGFEVGKVGTGPECLPVDYQYLERLDDNTLKYVVMWSSNIEARGVLNKIP